MKINSHLFCSLVFFGILVSLKALPIYEVEGSTYKSRNLEERFSVRNSQKRGIQESEEREQALLERSRERELSLREEKDLVLRESEEPKDHDLSSEAVTLKIQRAQEAADSWKQLPLEAPHKIEEEASLIQQAHQAASYWQEESDWYYWKSQQNQPSYIQLFDSEEVKDQKAKLLLASEACHQAAVQAEEVLEDSSNGGSPRQFIEGVMNYWTASIAPNKAINDKTSFITARREESVAEKNVTELANRLVSSKREEEALTQGKVQKKETSKGNTTNPSYIKRAAKALLGYLAWSGMLGQAEGARNSAFAIYSANSADQLGSGPIISNNDGSYYMGGGVSYSSQANTLLGKFDINGQNIWNSQQKSTAYPTSSITSTALMNGALYTAGLTTDSGGVIRTYISKNNLDGSLAFRKMYTALNGGSFTSLFPTSSGTLMCFGYLYPKGFILNIDSTGAVLSSAFVQPPSGSILITAAAISDTSYVIGGYTLDTPSKAWISRVDYSGSSWSSSWTRTYSTAAGNSQVNSIAVQGTNVIFAGSLSGTDGLVGSISTSGVVRWTKSAGGSNTDVLGAVSVKKDGSANGNQFMAVGRTSSGTLSSSLAAWYLLMNMDGSLANSITLDGSGSESGGSIAANSDGTFSAFGSTTSYGSSAQNLMFVTLDGNGQMDNSILSPGITYSNNQQNIAVGTASVTVNTATAVAFTSFTTSPTDITSSFSVASDHPITTAWQRVATKSPTTFPTISPTTRPTSPPSTNPSSQPSTQPSSQPTSQPSGQPSRQPVAHPTGQPSSHPSRHPSAHPSSQPSSHPSGQPSEHPSSQPTVQPSGQPSSQPSSQPTGQPSGQPTGQPSADPSAQPSSFPSTQPSGVPSAQPSMLPSSQPTFQPSSLPTTQPTGIPSSQPTEQPTFQPTDQPTGEPSGQPSAIPSSQPTEQPSADPSTQPSSLPTAQPSFQPTAIPTSQPTHQPMSWPTVIPTFQPSSVPTRQPTTAPSFQPFSQPSGQPSGQPSSQPTGQPSGRPTEQPSAEPSTQPTSYPTAYPSGEPSGQPTHQPSGQPTFQPSSVPTRQPVGDPTSQPTTKPSDQPTGQPTSFPSEQPSGQPSSQPTDQPMAFPSSQPSKQPFSSPTGQPTRQPIALPTGQPTEAPTSSPTRVPTQDNGEWVSLLEKGTSLNDLSFFKQQLMGCGSSFNNLPATCLKLDETIGNQLYEYRLPWDKTTSVTSFKTTAGDFLTLNGYSTSSSKSTLAYCNLLQNTLDCKTKTFSNLNLVTSTWNPQINNLLNFGESASKPVITALNAQGNNVWSSIYTVPTVASLSFTASQSLPIFVGSFFAGSSINTGAANSILAGWVRSDSGTINAATLVPKSSAIENKLHLANALVIEPLGPDSFIGGGMTLNDGKGMQAYLTRANVLYRSINYGVRFVSSIPEVTSQVKDIALFDNHLFLMNEAHGLSTSGNQTDLSMMKADPLTGNLLQQIRISAPGNISCSKMIPLGENILLSCGLAHGGTSKRLLFSVDKDFSFSKLPFGFERDRASYFETEPLRLTMTPLTFTQAQASFPIASGLFNSAGSAPKTSSPSLAPTYSLPSSNPSSAPTSAPSISAHPTSVPSSSTPTITHEPSVTPSVDPSSFPSSQPSGAPSTQPTTSPTSQPSFQPIADPTIQPTKQPITDPTSQPSGQPTLTPTVPPIPVTPLLPPSEEQTGKGGIPSYGIGVAAAGGAFGAGLSAWMIYKYALEKKKVQSEGTPAAQFRLKKRAQEMFAALSGSNRSLLRSNKIGAESKEMEVKPDLLQTPSSKNSESGSSQGELSPESSSSYHSDGENSYYSSLEEGSWKASSSSSKKSERSINRILENYEASDKGSKISSPSRSENTYSHSAESRTGSLTEKLSATFKSIGNMLKGSHNASPITPIRSWSSNHGSKISSDNGYELPSTETKSSSGRSNEESDFSHSKSDEEYEWSEDPILERI